MTVKTVKNDKILKRNKNKQLSENNDSKNNQDLQEGVVKKRRKIAVRSSKGGTCRTDSSSEPLPKKKKFQRKRNRRNS